MSDTRLRQLEHRAQAEGTTSAKAAVLTARVRYGILDQKKLELAAYLGEQAAITALGVAETVELVLPGVIGALTKEQEARTIKAVLSRENSDVSTVTGTPSLEVWAKGLANYGQEAAVRAALVAAQTIRERLSDRLFVAGLQYGRTYASLHLLSDALGAVQLLGAVHAWLTMLEDSPKRLPGWDTRIRDLLNAEDPYAGRDQDWWRAPGILTYASDRTERDGTSARAQTLVRGITSANSHTPVKSEIQRVLIPWSLS